MEWEWNLGLWALKPQIYGFRMLLLVDGSALVCEPCLFFFVEVG